MNEPPRPAGDPTAWSRCAVSRTVRESANSTPTGRPMGPPGPSGVRPRLGFSPTRPQLDAGMRSEPAPSLPLGEGNRPRGTRAAAPRSTRPTPRPSAHGLLVGPWSSDSVEKLRLSSGAVVWPSVTRPAARKRAIMG